MNLLARSLAQSSSLSIHSILFSSLSLTRSLLEVSLLEQLAQAGRDDRVGGLLGLLGLLGLGFGGVRGGGGVFFFLHDWRRRRRRRRRWSSSGGISDDFFSRRIRRLQLLRRLGLGLQLGRGGFLRGLGGRRRGRGRDQGFLGHFCGEREKVNRGKRKGGRREICLIVA